MTARTPWARYVALDAVYLGTSFLWNSLHPIVLPILLLAYGSEETKNTRLGVLTFVGLLVAMGVQPLAGALSDATRHRLGRRRPWILAGAAASALCLAGLAGAGGFGALAFWYLALQVASNAMVGPANALIPDEVPAPHRGPVSGLKNLLDMAGIVLAAAVTGRLMGGSSPRAELNLALIGALLLLSAGLTAWRRPGHSAAAPSPAAPSASAPAGVGPGLRRRLGVRLSENPAYARLLTSRFWLLLATYLVQSFALYYFRDALSLRDPAAAMGSLMTCIGIPLAVAALPAGILSERWGRRGLSLAACALVGVGLGCLLAARALGSIRALGAVVGLGMGVFVSVNWAWATDLVPAGEAGKYLGLANLATAGPSALARLMGPLIDAANGWRPGLGYTLLFALATLAAAVALGVTVRIPETRGRHAALPQPPANPA
ncbi:MAG: SLC45 family MFS transporter [Chloroflexi bacterium]|nr:SLC45 family MFS transporter [Chloroflexota bacterium]